MTFYYRFNSEINSTPKKNLFVQEWTENELLFTWSMEEIESRWRWPWDERKERESFTRCKQWLKDFYPELIL